MQTRGRVFGKATENDRFQIKYICVHKGRGVFAQEEIPAGEFLFEYTGKVISQTEGETRLLKIGTSYLYFLGDICIDGKKDHICSLVNDDPKKPNAIMKRIDKNRIGLFVRKENPIRPGEEITYSYADGFINMPWRKLEENVTRFKKTRQAVQVEDVPEKEDEWESYDEIIEAPQKRLRMEIESLPSTSTGYPTEIDLPINDNLDTSSSGSESEKSEYFTPKKKSVPRIVWTKINEKILSERFSDFISSKEGYPEPTEIVEYLESSKILSSLTEKERKNAVRRKLNNMKRLRSQKINKNKKKILIV